MAIQKVCLHLAETLPPTPSRYIRVHVDSQAAIQTVHNPVCTSQTVLDCREALDLLEDHEVSLRWVQAHAGHEYNERADELAKLGTTSDNLHHVAPPRANLHRYIEPVSYTHLTLPTTPYV